MSFFENSIGGLPSLDDGGDSHACEKVFLFVLDFDGVIQSVVHIPVAMCVGDTLHGLRRSLADTP